MQQDLTPIPLDKPMPLISIIIPIYNLATYLFQCIHSITVQTYENLEIILVDDGSTDNALEICEFFRKKDSRIKLITQKNSGLVSARKAGVAISTGDYIFYVDGDDWIDPGCIEEYLKHLKKNNAEIILGGYKREIMGKYETILNEMNIGFFSREQINECIIPTMIWDDKINNHGIQTYSWGNLFKSSLIKNLQSSIPNEIMVGEDAALLYPAIAQANSIEITSINKYNYRQRVNSILKSNGFDIKEEFKKIAIAFNYLNTKLSINNANKIKEQLEKYFQSICIIRAGGFISNSKLYNEFKIFGELPENSKIALYNSGSFGQHTYKQIQQNDSLNLIGWFDIDYEENNIAKMPILSPMKLKDYNFDYLLIPSFNNTTKKEILEAIKDINIQKEKIRFSTLGIKKTHDFIHFLGFNPIDFTSYES